MMSVLQGTLTKNQLSIYRLLAVFTASIFISFRFILPADAWDPMWLRLPIAGLFIAGAAGSFFVKDWMMGRLSWLANMMLVIISAWILLLVWKNSLMEEYVLAYFIILFSSIIIFNQFAALFAFSVGNALAGILVALSVTTPYLDKSLFVGSLFLVILMANIAFGYMIRAFENARFSNKRFRSIQEKAFGASRDGILVLDGKGNIQEANEQFLKIWDLPGEIIQDSVKTLETSAARALEDDVFLKNGTLSWPLLPEGELMRIRLKNGKILETYTRNLDAENKVEGNLLFFRDITQTLEREMNLERSNALIGATMDLSGLGILVSDIEGKPILWNSRYRAIWGMGEDFLRNARMEQVLAYCFDLIEDNRDLKPAVASFEEEPGPVHFRLIRLRDGRVLERSMQRMELDGKAYGHVWFFRDITDKVRAEEELVQRNFELDSFIYRASHDLRAPVSTIRGFVELARDQKDVETLSQFMEMVGRSAENLHAFTDRLSNFSRNERDKVEPAEIDLHQIVRQAYEELKPEISHKNQPELVIEEGGQLWSDNFRIRLILKNLMANSILYARPADGPVRITVGLEQQGPNARIWFQDNGQGIPDQQRDKIFDLFYRGHPDSKGSGLGLYVARKAARRLGGDLSLGDSGNGGARFLLELPEAVLEASLQVG